MNELNITKIKLTDLQEKILIKYHNNPDFTVIYKELDIKPITLSKALQTLKFKGLIDEENITILGKEIVNYYLFRNDTISKFLEKSNITDEILFNELKRLDLKIIIAIRNLLNNWSSFTIDKKYNNNSYNHK